MVCHGARRAPVAWVRVNRATSLVLPRFELGTFRLSVERSNQPEPQDLCVFLVFLPTFRWCMCLPVVHVRPPARGTRSACARSEPCVERSNQPEPQDLGGGFFFPPAGGAYFAHYWAIPVFCLAARTDIHRTAF